VKSLGPRPAAQQALSHPPPQTAHSELNEATSGLVRGATKSTLADWTGGPDDDEVKFLYGGEKRQRGGRKKRKKNEQDETVLQNWDDIYDPSRPNNYEFYKNSDEQIQEVREWKDRLYAHRIVKQRSDDSDREDCDRRGPLKSM